MLFTEHPTDDLAASLYSALCRDLPEITYQQPTWPNGHKGERVMVDARRRPTVRDVQVIMFVQTWADTSCMFRGGVAGQAITSAYTVVVMLGHKAFVYCSGSLAYSVDADAEPSKSKWPDFQKDLDARDLCDQRGAGKRYGARVY